MTDEEMADKWVDKKISLGTSMYNPQIEYYCKQAFLAGLKEGKDMAETDLATVAYMQGAERYKPKWHKVADGDLPKDENDVLVYSGEDWRMCVGRYSPKHKVWEAGCDTIAWCEIPQFKDKE